MKKIRKLIYLALLISIALVLHYIEHFFPPLAPGAKLGLANIVTMVCLYLFGFSEAMAVVVIRSILGPLLGGSPTAIMYSMAGGVLSCIIMAVLYFKLNNYFSLLGISLAGAVFHNIGQLLTASLIYGTIGIFFTYMPILMFSSVITGNFIGLVVKYIVRYISRKNLLMNFS